jgi:hypothetical protein
VVISARSIAKVVLTVVIAPLAIVLVTSLLAYAYFYLTTGAFAPGLIGRLLGLNPADIYLFLSLCFGFAVLTLVICGCVIYTAIEVYRIRKLLETPGRVFKQAP